MVLKNLKDMSLDHELVEEHAVTERLIMIIYTAEDKEKDSALESIEKTYITILGGKLSNKNSYKVWLLSDSGLLVDPSPNGDTAVKQPKMKTFILNQLRINRRRGHKNFFVEEGQVVKYLNPAMSGEVMQLYKRITEKFKSEEADTKKKDNPKHECILFANDQSEKHLIIMNSSDLNDTGIQILEGDLSQKLNFISQGASTPF